MISKNTTVATVDYLTAMISYTNIIAFIVIVGVDDVGVIGAIFVTISVI